MAVCELVLGADCPKDLRNALEDGAPLSEAVNVMDAMAMDIDCSVWLVSTPGGQLGVLKSYRRSMMTPERRLQVELEIELHRRVAAACPESVVQFWGAVDDATHTHILMEWCARGDLRAAAEAGALATERRVRDHIVRPLLQVLASLARQGVVHRDVKPDNIFVSSAGTVRLGDFGLAVSLRDNRSLFGAGPPSRDTGSGAGAPSEAVAGPPASWVESASDCGDVVTPVSSWSAGSGGSCSASPAAAPRGGSGGGISGKGRIASFASLAALALPTPQERAAGTAAYTAPEVLMAALTSTSVQTVTQPKNDVFSLGMVALECLTRRHPFGGPGVPSSEIVCALLSSQPVPLPFRRQPGGGGHFSACCPSDTHQGWGGWHGCDGSVVQQQQQQQDCPSDLCLEWLRTCLEKDPSRRPTAEELLAHPWMDAELPGTADDASLDPVTGDCNEPLRKQQRLISGGMPGWQQLQQRQHEELRGFWGTNELAEWALCSSGDTDSPGGSSSEHASPFGVPRASSAFDALLGSPGDAGGAALRRVASARAARAAAAVGFVPGSSLLSGAGAAETAPRVWDAQAGGYMPPPPVIDSWEY